MNITNTYLGHLKPCPKCQSNDVDFWFSTEMNYTRSYYIKCNECGYSTGECSGRQQAIDRWNEKNKNLI